MYSSFMSFCHYTKGEKCVSGLQLCDCIHIFPQMNHKPSFELHVGR